MAAARPVGRGVERPHEVGGSGAGFVTAPAIARDRRRRPAGTDQPGFPPGIQLRPQGGQQFIEPGRAAAIALAIRAARAGDIVLLAGKGHEKVQVLGDRTIPFDDVVVAENSLKEMR